MYRTLHIAQNEESGGVDEHDGGMMIPTTIRSPSTEQMPSLQVNDGRAAEKRKKARAAQQKHREKIKNEKDALIQKAALTDKMATKNSWLLNEITALRSQKVNDSETIKVLSQKLKKCQEECTFWQDKANYRNLDDPYGGTLFSPNPPDGLEKFSPSEEPLTNHILVDEESGEHLDFEDSSYLDTTTFYFN